MSIKAQHDRFAPVLSHLPASPGVYRYYAQNDDLLYIGKAKNLKNRVSSYFQESKLRNQRQYLLVNQIARIEYTIVDTEKESLLLEANLIYSLQPKFNILLKDEQQYLYLRFTYEDFIPTILIERKKVQPKSVYYGPFYSRARLSAVLRTIRIIFPYCDKRVPDGEPCAYRGLGMCAGICAGEETKEVYLARLAQIENILKGNQQEGQQYISEKITQAIRGENYELAAFWRDRAALLTQMFRANFAHQQVVFPQPEDIDLVTLVAEQQADGSYIGSLFLQNIRGGKMINVANFLFIGSEYDAEDSEPPVTAFLQQFFKNYYLPGQVVAPVLIQAFVRVAPATEPIAKV
jgi:excinuclease ABC subunit C